MIIIWPWIDQDMELSLSWKRVCALSLVSFPNPLASGTLSRSACLSKVRISFQSSRTFLLLRLLSMAVSCTDKYIEKYIFAQRSSWWKLMIVMWNLLKKMISWLKYELKHDPTTQPLALSHTLQIPQNSEIQSNIESSSKSEKEQLFSNEMLSR